MVLYLQDPQTMDDPSKPGAKADDKQNSAREGQDVPESESTSSKNQTEPKVT